MAWIRLGYDPDDPRTWAQQRVHMPSLRHLEVRDFAPKAWARGLRAPRRRGADRPALHVGRRLHRQPRARRRPRRGSRRRPPRPGWHKDGDFFRHFLDSPEQGLLTIVLWSDIEHRGGGTFVAADSVGPVARLLAERREGILPEDFDYDAD